MELFPGFFYFNVKKENFVDSSSIMAIKDSDGVSCIEVGEGRKISTKLLAISIQQE